MTQLVEQLNLAVPVAHEQSGDRTRFGEMITTLVNAFRSGDRTDRQEARSMLNTPARNMLLLYAWDRSILAVRQLSGERVREGLLALALEDGYLDFRDSIIRMAVLFHSAKKLGLDANAMFQEAANYSDNAVLTGIMRGYPSREPSARDLGENGWPIREKMTPEGFTYENYMLQSLQRKVPRLVRRLKWGAFLTKLFKR